MSERAPLPLFCWVKDVAARRHAVRRRGYQIAVVCLGCGLLLGTTVVRPAPRLVWNVSASAPLGLYLVTPSRTVHDGEMVLAWLPTPARRLADRRHYLPGDVPAVKRIAGADGDRICAFGSRIFINGKATASRLKRDGTGRLLPWWEGCRTLDSGDLFLLNADSRQSFDGRYAGISRAADVIGPAHLIWATSGQGRRP